MADPGHRRRRFRPRWGGCGAWRRTPPSARRSPRRRSRRRGRGCCASGRDKLPEQVRGDADAILLAAAASGADLADLGALVEEMLRRTARPDDDAGFADRWVRLDQTLEGAGRLAGDLTPQCAAAVRAVLDALGKRAGPEDLRTRGPA